MMKLRWTIAVACFSLIMGAGLGSCSRESEEDENASVVNVEKGVAPPVSTPDAAGGYVAAEEADQAAMYGGGEGEALQEQEIEELAQEEKTPEAAPQPSVNSQTGE